MATAAGADITAPVSKCWGWTYVRNTRTILQQLAILLGSQKRRLCIAMIFELNVLVHDAITTVIRFLNKGSNV